MGGGFSSNVYSGSLEGQECAIKVFKPHINAIAVAREVDMMMKLHHDGMVRMIAYDARQRTRWIAMELCE